MTEIEYNCKSFVEAATQDVNEESTLFVTICYNNGSEVDIIPKYDEKIYEVITKILLNKSESNIIKEIVLKSEYKDKVEILNKIEFN